MLLKVQSFFIPFYRGAREKFLSKRGRNFFKTLEERLRFQERPQEVPLGTTIRAKPTGWSAKRVWKNLLPSKLQRNLFPSDYLPS
ncbi:MAG: hypothetical protein Q7K21_01285, partial [Elusimicrobiota bacterium]|nr:hypothetical protein [Elusimicrobiota bacterium]